MRYLPLNHFFRIQVPAFVNWIIDQFNIITRKMRAKSKSMRSGKFRAGQAEKQDQGNEKSVVQDRTNSFSLKLESKLSQSRITEKTNQHSKTQPPKLENRETSRKSGKQQGQLNDSFKSASKPHSVESYRNLLPDYLNFKLPENLAHLWEVVSKIDKYLQNLPNKHHRQSFQNIQLWMEKREDFQLRQIHLQQINYILPAFYNFYRDPLNNLILGLPDEQSVFTRQHNLRKMMYTLHMDMLNSSNLVEDLPIRQLLTKRTSCFYSHKKVEDSQKCMTRADRIKNQFAEIVLYSVSQKQFQQNRAYQSSDIPTLEETKEQEECMRTIYRQKNVRSIYKATLVQLLRDNLGRQIGQIMKGMDVILSPSDAQSFQAVELQGRVIVKYVGENKKL